ncbi:MAG TPA: hypothetical protein VLE70_08720 [Anaerolineae bacterium]|jgi:hypothetical protein|nr:hypothetical protein [Anaerolineae bacterium]
MSTKNQQPEPTGEKSIHHYDQGKEGTRLTVDIWPLELAKNFLI